jgi:hypothetical protein
MLQILGKLQNFTNNDHPQGRDHTQGTECSQVTRQSTQATITLLEDLVDKNNKWFKHSDVKTRNFINNLRQRQTTNNKQTSLTWFHPTSAQQQAELDHQCTCE